MRRAALLLAVALALPVLAEEATIYCATSGLALNDLSPVLIEETAAPPAVVALPGSVVLTEPSAGAYTLTGLPDVAAGSGTGYVLLLSCGTDRWTLQWPRDAVTPSTLVSAPMVTQLVGEREREMVAGDTLPLVQYNIYGFDADPSAGSSLAFELYDWTGDALATAGTASVTPVPLDDGTWVAELRYSWAAADTAGLGGSRIWGRFVLTVAGADPITRPAVPRELSFRVYP